MMNWKQLKKRARELKRHGMEILLLPTGRGYTWEMLHVHHADRCVPPCVVHAPSKHKMADWFLIWRGDRGMFERQCSHGIGHPDPDDLAFKRRSLGDAVYRQHAFGVHGCDGCCHEG